MTKLTKSTQNFAKNSENLNTSKETYDENSLKFWIWNGAKVCESCRSRKMLKNAYLDAKIGFDTEENEPSKVL